MSNSTMIPVPALPSMNRRDYLKVATGAVGLVGTALVAWPFIDQMNPDASVLSFSTVEVDVSPIAVGQMITVIWRGVPVFVRHRTDGEIAAAKAVKIEDLKDPLARNQNVAEGEPATDLNRVAAGREEYLVMVGVCTHLGCVPISNEGEFTALEGAVKTGGWFCPCHGSHYDTAGRIRKGPAPENMLIPKFSYITDSKIKIGE